MKLRVYVETSVVSYLTARPSLDALHMARQSYSQQLWLSQNRYQLFVSDLVLDEAGEGDVVAAEKRLSALQGLDMLVVPDAAVDLAESLIRLEAMPAKAYADALHIACASMERMDLIASWNFRHIASIWARQKIRDALIQLGFAAPIIATPEDLMESH